MKRILCAVRATVFLILSAASASAQFETASIVGTVRDNSGAVIGEATVTLTNVATGVSQTKISDASGIFEFSTLRIGTYLVTAEKAGFAVAVADGIELTVGARQRVDLTMQVGQLTERVEVLAAATRLETDTSQRGQVITGDQTRALPLNGRDYSALALLTTGVRQSAIGTGGFTPREGSFNINGLRSTVNNFLIDGVDNNAYGTSNQGFSNQVMQPAPDAVAEFKVVTNNMSAEYGRAAGGVINVAYRSGTNAFHGSGFEFYRDTKFNATGFFKPPAGGKPPLERNQFGGVIGGPIIRNKAFFFADYEGFRQTRALVTTSTIPTVAQRQGVLTVAVTNPLTGSTIPAGSPIPMTTFARRVLEGLPEPTSAGTANNYAILQEFTNDTDKMGGKVDYQVSPRLSFFGRAGYRDVDITDQPPIPLPSGGDGNGFTYVTNKQVAFGSTWSPTNNSLFEFRFAWSDTTAGKNPLALGSGSAADLFGITGLPTDERVAGGLPSQLITGYSNLGRQATNPQWQFPMVFNPKINYILTRGRHSMKTGYEFQHIQTEVQDVNPLYGRDQYAGQITRPAGAAANNLYNLSDFMLGLRSTYALSNILVANLRQNMHFAYVQDDLRFNDKLTLNLGLRYEFATPHWEKDNVLSNFDAERRVMVQAQGRIARGSHHDQTGPQQLWSAPRPRLYGDAANGHPQRLRDQLRALPPCRRRQRSAHQRPAGDQRRRRADQPARPELPKDGAGFPGRTDRLLALRSACRQHYLHAARLPFESRAELVCFRATRARPEHDSRPRLRRERGGRHAALRQLEPGRAEQQRGHDSVAGTPSDPRLRGHHLLVQRRQVAIQRAAGEVRLAHARRAVGAQLADAVEDGGQRRRLAREPKRELPGAAKLLRHGRGLRTLRLPSAVQQHHERRARSCRSAAAAVS